MKRTIKPMTEKQAERYTNHVQNVVMTINVIAVLLIIIAATIVSCLFYQDIKSVQGTAGGIFSLAVVNAMVGIITYGVICDILETFKAHELWYVNECCDYWKELRDQAEETQEELHIEMEMNRLREYTNIDIE